MTEEERETHLSFMREALEMGEKALLTSETPVGCVFVHKNKIIGRGMNATNRSHNGTRHAEFLAVNEILTTPASYLGGNGDKDEIGKQRLKYRPEILKECDLYVTVEPCIMCASLLRQVGVRRVYYGASNEKFGGTGGVLDIHIQNGGEFRECLENEKELDDGDGWKGEGDYEVSGGWLREEAIVLLRRFYIQENGRAPEPRSKKERALKLEVEPLVAAGGGG